MWSCDQKGMSCEDHLICESHKFPAVVFVEVVFSVGCILRQHVNRKGGRRGGGKEGEERERREGEREGRERGKRERERRERERERRERGEREKGGEVKQAHSQLWQSLA